MGVKVEDVDPTASTGAVKFDPGPQEYVTDAGPLDGKSAGNVKFPKVQVEEFKVDHHGADPVLNVPTPGPVTMTVSWLPEEHRKAFEKEAADVAAKEKAADSPVETKVIDPPAKTKAKPATQAETK